MQPGGEEAAAAPQENPKRMRRPSVRLHQPYYENPGHRKIQQQWKPRKGATTPRKPRSAKTAHSKFAKNAAAKEGGKGEGLGNFDFEYDSAIGGWSNFTAANRDRDFQRKRVRSSNSKSREIGDQENGNLGLSSDGEGGELEQQPVDVEEEGDLGGNRFSNDLVAEDSDPSSPNQSLGDDDDIENRKLSGDGDNVGGKQRGLGDNRHSSEMGRSLMAGEEDGDSNGVRMWLNDLGLGKYVTLFEIHGVDDAVLPLLTLEDLKDMGINEVGIRRKLYSSIQKLDRWFP
ncbi:hypothetical protein SASPL_154874 [Salvia splendens]|uniref:SAM domain-containing protein n=1 Tax=Salvia splendens TaxID=180675 RepID=A0A8X8W0V7_SALSN|nr:uncharacterized protein LOC121786899 [Salvia splendens]KAG6385990.1 hypothetical protein SASPL_154874 [Salvia splendens]